MSQKSYNGTQTMYLVSTPIGNLSDFTYRAVQILNEVDVIFSEDTRVTANLLNHYNIKKPLLSAHKFNENLSVEKMLDYLLKGKNIALVSDRGTPLISDPGNFCVKTIVEKGYNVVAIPGATALIPALIVSGLESDKFLFYGFLNNKQSKRREELKNLKENKFTIIFYEAPHRINTTLQDILKIFGDRNISVSREISKKFEEIYRGQISSIINEIKEPKGEYVLVIDGNKKQPDFSGTTVENHYKKYIKEGYSEKEAMKLVAKDRNISKSEVYKIVKLFPGK
jgi:16S rRNA (cytidine1402-2'-O)-methyltransferase